MRLGVGLPSVIPATPPDLLLEWAGRADDGPFTSVGVLDRLAYDSHDPLQTLAAAAAVTERVRLVTMVVAAPLRATDLLAKEAAAANEASGGRLVLGVAVGARAEDYEAARVDPRGRGRRLDEQLREMPELWERQGHPRPPILVGGTADVAFARMARYADGYVHGGGPPRAFAGAAGKARAAWADFDRPGKPELWGQSYFALGDDDTLDLGRAYMRDYYAFTGPFAERIAEGLLTTPQAIAQQVRGYAEAGCDELVLLPAVRDPGQIDRLVEVVGGT